jgi:hypothetical protein
MANDAFTIVAAVNNDVVLQQNLLLSPDLTNGGRNQLILKRHFASASTAYNSAIEEADHDVIIFVHQDVYLPEAWFDDLEKCLTFLNESGAPWGVLGCFGSRKDAYGGLGRVYTTGLGYLGRQLDHPEVIETLDEAILVVRKSSGLRFDSNLPHYHLYGTDICLAARQKGLANYAFQGCFVHNTNQLLTLPTEYYDCYRYIRQKWTQYLPIYTACMTISRLNGEYYRKRITDSAREMLGLLGTAAKRVDDPRIVCHFDRTA